MLEVSMSSAGNGTRTVFSTSDTAGGAEALYESRTRRKGPHEPIVSALGLVEDRCHMNRSHDSEQPTHGVGGSALHCTAGSKSCDPGTNMGEGMDCNGRAVTGGACTKSMISICESELMLDRVRERALSAPRRT